MHEYRSGSSHEGFVSLFCFIAVKDWLSLVPFVGTVSLIVYVTSHTFQEKWEQYQGRNRDNLCKVNLSIKKCSDKVVDMVDIEDLGDKVVYCRCWRSATVSSAPIQDSLYALKNLLYFILFYISCLILVIALQAMLGHLFEGFN